MNAWLLDNLATRLVYENWKYNAVKLDLKTQMRAILDEMSFQDLAKLFYNVCDDKVYRSTNETAISKGISFAGVRSEKRTVASLSSQYHVTELDMGNGDSILLCVHRTKDLRKCGYRAIKATYFDGSCLVDNSTLSESGMKTAIIDKMVKDMRKELVSNGNFAR